VELTVAASIVCAILGAVFGYLAFTRNKSHDNQEEGRQLGVILTELGGIKSNTEDIKIEQKEQRKFNTDMLVRLTKVEASAEKAHYRLDHIETAATHKQSDL